MQTNEYFGLAFKVEYSDKTDGTGFQTVGNCYDLSPSNDSDDVSRNWTDGSSQQWKTNFAHSIDVRVSKTTAANLGILAPQNIYESGDAIDGLTGATAGTTGAVQIGEPISGKTSSFGILKLTPLDSTQDPIYYINATTSLGDLTLDDNLGEVTCTISAEKVIKGALTFA